MQSQSPAEDSKHQPELNRVVIRNIRALVSRRKEEESKRSFQGRLADAITRFTGSMFFVYLHLVLFGVWIIINVGWAAASAV